MRDVRDEIKAFEKHCATVNDTEGAEIAYKAVAEPPCLSCYFFHQARKMLKEPTHLTMKLR